MSELTEKAAAGAGAVATWLLRQPFTQLFDVHLLGPQRRKEAEAAVKALTERRASKAEAMFCLSAQFKEMNYEIVLSMAEQIASSDGDQVRTPPRGDWLVAHMEGASNAPDDELRRIWACLLVEEATTPESVSKSTLELLRGFDRADADLFAALCACTFHNPNPFPAILELNAEPYLGLGLDYSALIRLQELGVVHLQYPGTKMVPYDVPACQIRFYETMLEVKFANPNGNSINIGHVDFTRGGRDLLRVVSYEPDPSVLEYCVQSWERAGVRISRVDVEAPETAESEKRWNAQVAKSNDLLVRLADEALAEEAAGLTRPMREGPF